MKEEIETQLNALKNQLDVLHILDNTASDWPGVVDALAVLSRECTKLKVQMAVLHGLKISFRL